LILAGVSSAGCALYFFFIKYALGPGTQRYVGNFSLKGLISALLASSLFVKAIIGFSFIVGIIIIYDFLRKQSLCHPLFIVCPLWAGIFLVLLLPWGISTYLLAPLAPFIMACLFFVVLRFLSGFPSVLKIIKILVVFGIVFTLFGSITPRISKMADKRLVVEAVMSLKRDACFFYPPPIEETAGSLRMFTGAEVNYVERVTPQEMVSDRKNFLIVNDEAGSILLKNVALGQEVYRNGTWRIWLLQENPEQSSEVKLLLPRTIFRRIKDMVS
jgi:hypothetical protein